MPSSAARKTNQGLFSTYTTPRTIKFQCTSSQRAMYINQLSKVASFSVVEPSASKEGKQLIPASAVERPTRACSPVLTLLLVLSTINAHLVRELCITISWVQGGLFLSRTVCKQGGKTADSSVGSLKDRPGPVQYLHYCSYYQLSMNIQLGSSYHILFKMFVQLIQSDYVLSEQTLPKRPRPSTCTCTVSGHGQPV